MQMPARIVPFKRPVYERVVKAFSRFAAPHHFATPNAPTSP
jgi:putative (di)nucleoside polyphosphate hydrolase